MIPFQLGFRNLIGILLPGAVLALVIFTCLDILFPGMGQAIARETGNNAGSFVVGFLLTAYILGSVIRLHSSDTVDRFSASLVRVPDPFEGMEGSTEQHLNDLLVGVTETEPSGKSDNEYFKELLERIRDRRRHDAKVVNRGEDSAANDLIKWAWKNDEFPYPVWELMKLRLYHPGDVFQFFAPYMRCFATGHRRNKEFFNYCKAVIYEAHEGKRHALAEEVQSAEAYVRFFAGVFWALLLSAGTLVVASAAEFILRERATAVGMILVAVFMLGVNYMIVIHGRFSLSRLKEVDTVFDAFFLVQRHPYQCPYCSAKLSSKPEANEKS